MALGTIRIEGSAEYGINEITCVCEKCNHREAENATIEFNFREKKVYSLCSKCKHMNEMFFGKDMPPPLPRVRVGR
jgi:hypothetical protein